MTQHDVKKEGQRLSTEEVVKLPRPKVSSLLKIVLGRTK